MSISSKRPGTVSERGSAGGRLDPHEQAVDRVVENVAVDLRPDPLVIRREQTRHLVPRRRGSWFPRSCRAADMAASALWVMRLKVMVGRISIIWIGLTTWSTESIRMTAAVANVGVIDVVQEDRLRVRN